MDEYVFQFTRWARRQYGMLDEDIADQVDEALAILSRHPTKSKPLRDTSIRDCQIYRFRVGEPPYADCAAHILFHYLDDEQTLIIYSIDIDDASNFGMDDSF